MKREWNATTNKSLKCESNGFYISVKPQQDHYRVSVVNGKYIPNYYTIQAEHIEHNLIKLHNIVDELVNKCTKLYIKTDKPIGYLEMEQEQRPRHSHVIVKG